MEDPPPETNPPTFQDPSILMEELIEHLKLLNYEEHFLSIKGFKPLTKAQFVIPGSNPSEQFYYFTSLVTWLLQSTGSNTSLNKYDDPSTVASNIIVELKKQGVELSFAPGKLRLGHGEGPCMVLLALAKQALKSKNFKFSKPVFPEDDDLVDEYISENESEEEIDEFLVYSEEEEVCERVLKEEFEEFEEEVIKENSPIWSEVDPEEWMLEVERISPRLKMPVEEFRELSEWRVHLEQTKSYKQKVEHTFLEVHPKISWIAESLETTLEKISFLEKKINKSLPEMTESYFEKSRTFSVIKQKYNEKERRIIELASSLEAYSERLEKVSEDLDRESKKFSDSQPLKEIKSSLKAIKNESRDLEIRTAVLSHARFQAKLRNS